MQQQQQQRRPHPLMQLLQMPQLKGAKPKPVFLCPQISPRSASGAFEGSFPHRPTLYTRTNVMQSYRGHCVRQRQNECSATNENDPNQPKPKKRRKMVEKTRNVGSTPFPRAIES